MLHRVRVSVLLSLGMALASCATNPPSPGSASASGYELQCDADRISLRFTRALTVPEFLHLAQEVTKARYVYRSDQVANSGPVSFLGQIRCRRDDFPQFVSTLLYVHGLQAEARGEGEARYLEVTRIPPG